MSKITYSCLCGGFFAAEDSEEWPECPFCGYKDDTEDVGDEYLLSTVRNILNCAEEAGRTTLINEIYAEAKKRVESQ
jgi:hypothetical protein